MESQEDSIDIVKLQRVALGLEHEPPQPLLAGSARTEIASQDKLTHFYHQAGRSSDSHALSTGCGLPSDSLSRPASISPTRRPRPSSPVQHEGSPMNLDNSGAEPEIVPGTQGQMSSAEGPGDTQVVSQSVFDSVIKQNGESMYRDMSQTGADGATLMTLHEGDSGHIDLLSQFDAARHASKLSHDQDDHSSYDTNESSPMAYQQDHFPESQRFLKTTPATTAKKYQASNMPTETPSVSRNPLAGDIESSGGILALSQAFKATQAPSSPLAHGLQPDIVSDRPSPNIHIQHSRLAPAISSPLMSIPVNLPRDSSETNFNYISMKESQTKRDKAQGERMTRSADNLPSEDMSDKEFYKEPSFVERARRQRQIDEDATAQFAGLTAPARSTSNLAARQLNVPQGLSPQNAIDELQDIDAMQQPAASEEETEQEEDLGHQVSRSPEVPHSSTEEDKENYDGPLIQGAASAHDRLSQALEIPSQVMVRDSQQSSKPAADEMHEERSRHYDGSQIDPVSEVENASPVQRRLQSSPPYSKHEQDAASLSHTLDQEQRVVPEGSPSARRNYFPIHAGHNKQSDGSSHPDSSNHSYSRTVDESRSGLGLGFGDKSSSNRSRVAETPVHQRPKSSGDMARLTSIPETSPNHSQYHGWEAASNGDAANNEDDDLPPIRSAHKHRVSQPPVFEPRQWSSPAKQFLSSPSGRQRRALTEIAADASPQFPGGLFDVASLLTADDREFRSVVDGSPTRPRKKRRGNESQIYHAPLPVSPITPQQQPPKTIAPISKEPTLEEDQPVESVQVPETTTHRQSRSHRRNENVWEIEGSPQQIIRRRSRRRKSTGSRNLDEKRAPAQNLGKPVPARPVVVHNPNPEPSSDLTELNSDDVTEPTNSVVEEPPSTPQAAQYPSDSLQIAPCQILAPWSGPKRAYYPATCFGTPLGVSLSKYRVKFEDSAFIEVPKGAVKRLELRIGDAVKVDMPNVPKVTHIVRGFDDKLTREELTKAVDDGLLPLTDSYGHSTVILGPKQRKSLPAGGLNTSENVIKVPIARIYLDTILWNQLKGRAYTYQAPTAQQESKLNTPSERASAPVSPTARLSRSVNYASGIFADMAFAVSYKEDEVGKNRITRLIIENGGSLLHDGFTELFDASSILPLDTPTEGHVEDTDTRSEGLRLTASAEEVGFACLIADTHSRREKYMQALALNLPCLSGRWVEDCVSKGHVLDWDVYLLPAGDSMYLNGATKSRVLTPTPPLTARLADTISARSRLLDGQSVLLVMGRGKVEEKRRAYIFLTYALGASRVERVPDLETARALLESSYQSGLSSKWNFIYVDDADQTAAKSMLAGIPKSKTQRIRLVHGGRKRRKSEVMTLTTASEDVLSGARVVGNEFVCQSLILGRLFDD